MYNNSEAAAKAFGALSPPLFAIAADTQLWALGVKLIADDVVVCNLRNAPIPAHLLATLLVEMSKS